MQDWTDEFDVVVVGSGGGALTGAYAAASQGLRTVVLEKTALFGGTSSYSGGSVWLPGTQVQERAELPDSTELARTYLRNLLGDAEADRLDAYVETAPVVVEFLERDPNIEFEFRAFPDYFKAEGRLDTGRSINALDLDPATIGDLAAKVRPELDQDRTGQGHKPGKLIGGRALIGRLLAAAAGTGNADLRTGTALTGLVVEDGRVVGVEAVQDGKPVRIKATRGVLMAAGGIEANAETRAANGTPGKAEWSMGPIGANTGVPIAAGVAAGGATALLDQAWFCPGVEQPDGTAAFLVGIRGGIVVDEKGERYLNESLPYDQFGRAMKAHSGNDAVSWMIFDSRERGGLPGISIPNTAPAKHLEAGTWVQGDTLEDLAARAGLPADAVRASVEQFNDYAKHGVDESFHRGEDPYDNFFCPPNGNPNSALTAIETGPFYAARIVLSDLGGKGGLVTDADGRVLRADGSAIDGLYAAGNTSASVSGEVYPGPGVPLGTAMVFSYRAAQHMKG
ncbi:FAD-dependent oxidoreductase [Rhodococcus spelaei]|uniref:3-oxosteroid 1-dehydrogenase n=1 Tax=Rhodococcus spelaei TaxID=2546320 RepID=A0A541B9K6_9NOCA|nr:FAD-dependent oxidoreductase [Rhodococcus spelaei]TQF69006.1 FAD-dependent oxidoreductase [Rhodococcus spelaei]